MTTTVRDHFERAFPGHAYEEEMDSSNLESMPLDSECGDACKAAIDAGAVLAAQVRLAFGEHRPQRIAAIADAVVDVCACFICG